MKKEVLSILSALMIVFLTSCGGSDQGPFPQPSELSYDPSESTPTSEASDTAEALSEGIYREGDYISAGKYIVTCTEADYQLKVVVFETSDDYDQYEGEERVTNGDEMAAIEKHALSDLYLEPDESGFISFPEGAVLMFEFGRAKLTEYSGDVCYPGVYFIGDDLEAGQYEIQCTNTDFAMNLIVFADRQAYNSYYESNRFTNGEEDAAIEQNAETNMLLSKDDTQSIYLNEGSVLLLKYGTGTMKKLN